MSTTPVVEVPPGLDTELHLSPGERINAWRRRAVVGQAEAAKKFGVTVNTIIAWERHRTHHIPPPDLSSTDIDAHLAPEVISAQSPQPGDWCFFLRRRLSIRGQDIARELGVSGSWVTRAERGVERMPTLILTNYWVLRVEADGLPPSPAQINMPAGVDLTGDA